MTAQLIKIQLRFYCSEFECSMKAIDVKILFSWQNVVSVIIGGTLGHAICTGLAVIGGRLIAQRISVRTGNNYHYITFNFNPLSPSINIHILLTILLIFLVLLVRRI